MDKLWFIHRMGSYSDIKSNEVLIHATRWIHLENVLSERNHTRKTIHCMILIYMKCPEQANPQKHQTGGCQGLERGYGATANGWFLFETRKKFWIQTVVMVAQQCVCNQRHWIVHFKLAKMVKFLK